MNLPEKIASGADAPYLEAPLPQTPPKRRGLVVFVALLQGAGLWIFPKFSWTPLLAFVCVIPTVFYLTERNLSKGLWLPPLIFTGILGVFMIYACFVLDLVEVQYITIVNGALFFFASFLVLPFVQGWTELGFTLLPAREFSARMNRNVTLLLLSGLALLPASIVLGFSMGNITWGNELTKAQYASWNPISPFGFFCFFSPLIFAGAITWAQDAGSMGEGAALPFLRKTIGVVSGWVALLAGIGMAAVMLSAIITEKQCFPTLRRDNFTMLLIVAGFFWTSMSLACREGTWLSKPRAFRLAMQACVALFPLFTLWILGGVIDYASEERHYLGNTVILPWSWQTMALGALVLASFGHGIMLAKRRWPEKASFVNVCVHLAMLATILVSRFPFADPVRYEAFAKAQYLVDEDIDYDSWQHKELERGYGRYVQPAFETALGERGMSREEWKQAVKSKADQAEQLAIIKREQALRSLPVSPAGIVIPEDAVVWVARYDEGRLAGLLRSIISDSTSVRILIHDLDNDGEPEIALINFFHRRGLLIGKNKAGEWTCIGQLEIPPQINPEAPVGDIPPQWNTLTLGGIPLPLEIFE